MASLGEESARVRVRRLTEDESFLLGALHLQALRRRGVDPSSGRSTGSHVTALAAAWQLRSADLPAWVAECDEQHVGMAVCRLPVLPHVGRGLPELIALEPLGAPGPEPVALALVRAVVTWFGREGYPSVDVSPEVALPGAVLDAARADVLGRTIVSLPTRP
ncbi:hypothetical protein GCM10009584_28660 [Ornithinimicrobium humiphilum]|uniref:Uncharacterized protein n=1 Tax=Ornithinimicrobium humiphilum TaxID=125288 RepID=A0A543KNS5_9MICO|nr:hypothetical protein [Ornithinimicrobium humiphilum]TQM96715.1 hypothetical protein FB476_1605 [Ornithinimicrobium humiphilum]